MYFFFDFVGADARKQEKSAQARTWYATDEATTNGHHIKKCILPFFILFEQFLGARREAYLVRDRRCDDENAE